MTISYSHFGFIEGFSGSASFFLLINSLDCFSNAFQFGALEAVGHQVRGYLAVVLTSQVPDFLQLVLADGEPPGFAVEGLVVQLADGDAVDIAGREGGRLFIRGMLAGANRKQQ
ncbi:hypothetical protein OPIT5_21270 [Opitutaceae bacterium TAV5]|nr:hypothetical protein OPIT5_21270 [Opitutaceae bacterium TAV5]